MKRSPLGRDPEKARAWERRSRKNLRRKKRMNPLNSERRARLYERNFGAKADWIRRQPCYVTGRSGPSDPAHTRARGMGGCGGDRTDLVPLCREAHRDFDGVLTAKEFGAKYGITKAQVVAAAVRYGRRWQAVRDGLEDLEF